MMEPIRFYSASLIFLMAITLAAPTSHAQSSSLSGRATDESGAVFPGAEITVTNAANGLQRTILSNNEGLYIFAQLPPGSYTLAATQPGFQSVTIEGVTLLVNTNVELPVTFEVAALTESVTVSAVTKQLNTTDASVGNAFGIRPISQLPLNERNPAGLLSLQAGVTFISADPLDTQRSADIRNGSVNGAESDQSNVTLDGVDVNDQNGRTPFTSVLRNTLDSIQEFRVVTTTANADQGRSSGAQVSLVTKSGTNEVHGSLYEFHRNTITAANDFFNNRASVDRPKLIRNVFGGSLGGPVKRGRVFYFVNYEGRRDASEGNAVRRVPEESMTFLGYWIGCNYRPGTGAAYIGTRPSRESVQSICRRVSELTAPRHVRLPSGVVVERLNRLLTGWANYFTLGQVRPAYKAIDQHATRRLRQWLCRKHKVRTGKHVRFPSERLWSDYGLTHLAPRTAGLPWAKA